VSRIEFLGAGNRRIDQLERCHFTICNEFRKTHAVVFYVFSKRHGLLPDEVDSELNPIGICGEE
jgi:hypothetical protein